MLAEVSLPQSASSVPFHNEHQHHSFESAPSWCKGVVLQSRRVLGLLLFLPIVPCTSCSDFPGRRFVTFPPEFSCLFRCRPGFLWLGGPSALPLRYPQEFMPPFNSTPRLTLLVFGLLYFNSHRPPIESVYTRSFPRTPLIVALEP